jgi:hypothetical protein
MERGDTMGGYLASSIGGGYCRTGGYPKTVESYHFGLDFAVPFDDTSPIAMQNATRNPPTERCDAVDTTGNGEA